MSAGGAREPLEPALAHPQHAPVKRLRSDVDIGDGNVVDRDRALADQTASLRAREVEELGDQRRQVDRAVGRRERRLLDLARYPPAR